jgi:hypothetical protein
VRRFAFFVEGQTEALFVERLITEIVSEKNVKLEFRVGHGGRRSSRSFVQGRIQPKNKPMAEALVYVLIYISQSDNRVASDVRDQYDSLVKQGYEGILALRDVYPDFTLEEVGVLRSRLLFGQKTKPFPPTILLAIMEIEAWLIAEHSHFARMDPALTDAEVEAQLGVAFAGLDVERLPHPAETLAQIYRRVGLGYGKTQAQVDRTLAALDFATLYLSVSQRVSELKRLCESIEAMVPVTDPPS